MADSTLSNLTSLTLPSQATDLLLVGRGTARPNKVALSDALNSSALAATTSTYGVAQLAASGGTTAGTVVQATDARLSDARNPPDGSKGDIVVSGSGSTWTIKTNPTFKGIATVATTGGVATHVLEYTGGNSLFTGYNATNSVFAQNGGASMTLSNSVTIAAAGSNQPITLTPSGAATAGSLTLSRLTSTNQTLALLNYGTDELMSIVGTGYTGVGSRSNTGFLLYSNNTERARFMPGGNLLIGKTIDNTLGRLQVNGAITMEETAGTGLFGFFGGSSLIYGSLAANPVVLRTNNTAALTLDTSQNATFAKDILLGTSGPSVPTALSQRAPRQLLAFDGTAGTTANIPAFGTGNFALAFTLRLNALPSVAAVIFGQSGGGAIPQTYVLPSGVLKVDGSSAINSATTLAINKTYHIVVTRSGTTTSIYIDGVVDTSATDTKDYSSAIDQIGRNSGGNYFNGLLGPVAYNRALSAAEVKALYENGVPAAADINSASNTSLLTGANSDFSSAGNWVPNPPANISGGKLNLLNTHANNTAINLVAGKRYRIAFTLDSITAGNVAVYNGSAYLNITGTAGAVSYEFNVLVATTLFVRCTGGDAVVDNMFLYPLGAVLAPDAAQTGGGLTWYDTSGNGANIALPASGVAWNVPFSGNVTSAGQLNLFSGGTSNITLAPTGAGQVVISNNSGAGTATRLTISQPGVRLFYIENTATTGNLTFGDGGGEYLRLIGSGAGTFLFGTTTNSNNGRIQLATHTASTGGIGFGTDISLSRSAGDSLDFTVSTGAPTLRFMNGAVYRGYVGTNGPLTVLNSQAGGIQLQTNATVALTLDTSQNGILAGSYFFIGGAGSNFYIRSTGANNGLIRGNNVSVDCASDFLFRNGDGTTEYARVVGSSGTFLFGTATNSSNGRLQLATHTASTGGIGFGTDVSLYRSAASTVTIGGNLVVTGTITPSSGAGLTNVWIPASQWIPRTTTGCGVDSTQTTTNLQNFDELLFDAATIEYAQALVRMPSNYNNGTVTARFFWSSSSSTGSVVWALQARAFADDDALDTAFGTAQTVTDTLLATGDMHISAATSAITSGGTPAATTPLQFQIYRDATNGSDTLGSDARLLGVEISYTSV